MPDLPPIWLEKLMATHSNLSPDDLTQQNQRAPGHDVRSLGPSDSSDTGADVIGPGQVALDADSDREGTGERATAGKEEDIRADNDIAPDRIVGPEEAGLGRGLDEAEEAQIDPLDQQH
jgi:hypothetical protein